jgi:hypothetical protein
VAWAFRRGNTKRTKDSKNTKGARGAPDSRLDLWDWPGAKRPFVFFESFVSFVLNPFSHPPRTRSPSYDFVFSACARIAESVWPGLMASVSNLTCRIEGNPEATAASNAGPKSAVRSTVAPKPPKARA